MKASPIIPAKLDTTESSYMTLGKPQRNWDTTKGSKRLGFFWFTFFSFSTAAIAEGAGV
jgi:hypothetical protein